MSLLDTVSRSLYSSQEVHALLSKVVNHTKRKRLRSASRFAEERIKSEDLRFP